MTHILLQGNLDKGCGFYAILNAISEVNKMTFERSVEIFGQFCRDNPKIASKGYLSGLYFTEMRDKVIPQIIDLLTEQEKVACSFPFSDMKFKTTNEFADRLRPVISDNACAIVGFGHPWNHWTAATSVTEHAIILKDSTHHQRKMIGSLQLACNDGEYREGTVIHSRQTIVFSR